MNTANELDIYATWVMYVVAGGLREADAIMREHGPLVEKVAKDCARRSPPTSARLYRGLLLPESAIIKIKPGHLRLELDPALMSMSWSEDPDVACWFADRHSVISYFVTRRRPLDRGYITTATPKPAAIYEKLLFHWSWGLAFPYAEGRTTDLRRFRHPTVPMDQSAVEGTKRWAKTAWTSRCTSREDHGE